MQSTQSTHSPGAPPPRARVSLSIREMALGLAVVTIGAVMTWEWLRSPDGHTGRRMLTGVMALVLGVTAMALSVRRACSACGTALGTFKLQVARGLVPAIEQSFSAGDGAALASLLRQALAESANASNTTACSFVYCEGCRGLLTLECSDGHGVANSRVITGGKAMDVIPAVEVVVREGRGRDGEREA